MNKKELISLLAAIATIIACVFGIIFGAPPAIIALRQLGNEFFPTATGVTSTRISVTPLPNPRTQEPPTLQSTNTPKPTDALELTDTPKPQPTTAEPPTSTVPPSLTATPAPKAEVPLEQMTILQGTYAYKPDTVIRGMAYSSAMYFNEERVVVRLLKEYKWLTMKVGVDDKAGLKGWKRFWVKDENGNALFEGKAEPVKEPVVVKADISQADWIEITAIDYNNEPPNFIRWVDVKFIPTTPSSTSSAAQPTPLNIITGAGTPLEKMTILEGTYTRKPDTIIRRVAYPNALYLNKERIVVRLLKEYKLLAMKVGVDDQAKLSGWKRFWVKDEKGNILFEGTAEPIKEPVAVLADVSHADWIEITALDYNNQPPNFIRWVDVQFFR